MNGNTSHLMEAVESRCLMSAPVQIADFADLQDTQDTQSSWVVQILPYIEQDNLYSASVGRR